MGNFESETIRYLVWENDIKIKKWDEPEEIGHDDRKKVSIEQKITIKKYNKNRISLIQLCQPVSTRNTNNTIKPKTAKKIRRQPT